MSLIISIKEARKILGRSYLSVPDQEIEKLINHLEGILEVYFLTVPNNDK